MEGEFYFDSEIDGITKDNLIEIDMLLKKCEFIELSNLLKNIFNNKIAQFTNHDYFSQIIISIYLFVLLKLQKYSQIADLLNKLKLNDKNVLFSIKFFEAKYYYMINDFQTAIMIYDKLIKRYCHLIEEEITIKEENAKFLYFSQFFNNILSFNNKSEKIKKCVFEIKNIFVKLGMNIEAYKIIEKYYEKENFNDDIVFIFELLKQSILISDFHKVEELYGKIKQLHLACSVDNTKKLVYENYLSFAECLTWISKGEFEIAKNKCTEILRNNPDNVIIINNISLLNIYLNKVDKAYLEFKIILDKDQMNCFNDITFSNINTLTEVFNLSKYP